MAQISTQVSLHRGNPISTPEQDATEKMHANNEPIDNLAASQKVAPNQLKKEAYQKEGYTQENRIPLHFQAPSL